MKPRGTHQWRMRSGSTKERNTSCAARRAGGSGEVVATGRSVSLAFAAMGTLGFAACLLGLQIGFQAVEVGVPKNCQ